MSQSAALNAVLQQQTRQLKLPAVLREYPALCRQARAEGSSHEELLKEILDAEICSRHERVVAQRLKEARFPDLKTFEQLDWEALQGVPRATLHELSRGEWIDRRHDVVLAGPIGTGKTHIAIALGVEAARRKLRVAFTRAADLVRTLIEARDQRALTRLHQRLQTGELLVVDELGFVPFERAGGELLFNLLAARYERRSTLVTTNLAFSEWVGVFGDEKLTTALLDRLSHHAHVLTTKGPSYRARKRTVKG